MNGSMPWINAVLETLRASVSMVPPTIATTTLRGSPTYINSLGPLSPRKQQKSKVGPQASSLVARHP
jgi:hypothetical protein